METNRPDMEIIFNNENEDINNIKQGFDQKNVSICQHSDETNSFYVTNNKSLYFARDESLTTFLHFDLVRIKLAFKLHLEDNLKKSSKLIGGEVIDLSIQHIDAANQSPPIFETLQERKESNKYVTYSITTTKGNIYSIESYSIHGLIYDLTRILFIEPKAPWEDDKYEKRLRRLMALLLCEALIERSNGFDKQALDLLMNSLNEGDEFYPPPNTIWELVINKVKSVYDAFADDPNIVKFKETMSTLVRVNCELIDMNEQLKENLYSRVLTEY